MAEQVALPEPIRAYLVALIRERFSTRDPEPPLAALPHALEPGVVHALARGGAYGWRLDARLDEHDGRLALECLEDSRMAGPEHYRVWEDGTSEPLPGEHTAYAYGPDATEADIEATKQAFYDHNRTVQAHLRERGFLA